MEVLVSLPSTDRSLVYLLHYCTYLMSLSCTLSKSQSLSERSVNLSSTSDEKCLLA
ncbi:hypothetical protein L211DRAFT_842437 [Terfezia boudieri ATCC MYA-4762]|uniref:Uncharacterized protein n=1 Tax=Terfezia boudieri ATCC MYA-4762 TaxID=1051890 RepID=A0A3N4LE23_9PEZI|nr:hypothetical protein L211DRAFT_842437 [Terfezia boudieri ATCC MYA-4762]